jgi:tetratricopeptide (TPR) repeat protein
MLSRTRNAQLYAEGTSARKRRNGATSGVRSSSVSGRPNALRALRTSTVFVVLAALFVPAQATANGESTTLRTRGSQELYNLDRELAIDTYRKAIAADPQDVSAYRGLASALWLSITFRRGNMTVDDYLGGVSRTRATPTPPPPEVVAAFNDALEHAISLARARVAVNPNDAAAHYELGAAVGLRASYIATVDGSAIGAFKAARGAYDEHEQVLRLDSSRKDAGLIVGTYRYIVATLSMPLRWMAYVAGFGGGREQGLQLVEDAAAYGGDNQVDARLALLVMYNRERRYSEALTQLAMLREKYPRNRLMWLESGSTSMRAGKPADADRFLTEGLGRYASDPRPKMFGEETLWLYKRGLARAALNHNADARADLQKALTLEGRNWAHGRAHLELGKLALKTADRTSAKEHLQTAIRLCENDNDKAGVEEAKKLLK